MTQRQEAGQVCLIHLQERSKSVQDEGECFEKKRQNKAHEFCIAP